MCKLHLDKKEGKVSRSETKNLERHYFNQFTKAFPLPEGEVEHSDRPDFRIIDTKSRKTLLGIEQTRFYIESGSSSEQVQAKLRIQIVKETEAKYIKECGKNLRLSISFNKKRPIFSVDDTVKRFIEVVKALQRTDSNQVCRSKFTSIPEVDFLYAQWDIEAPWQLTQVHSTPLTSKSQLQDIVSSKDSKASSYEECPELWLLVIIDFFDFAQDQEIDDNINSLHSEKFSKVILFKTVFNKIKEIPCTRGRR